MRAVLSMTTKMVTNQRMSPASGPGPGASSSHALPLPSPTDSNTLKRSSTLGPGLQRLGSTLSHRGLSVAKLVNFEGEFQDAEGILSTQMLVAAIILSIVVTLHTGTFGHNDLIAGDVRHAMYDEARGKDLSDDTYMRLLSGRLLVDGYVAVSCSTLSLLFAAQIYVSLIFSGARGDPELFRRWWRLGRIWILLSYVPLLVSIFYFLRLNHDSVYMVYPKYNWNADFNFSTSDIQGSARLLGAAADLHGSGRFLSTSRGSASSSSAAAGVGSYSTSADGSVSFVPSEERYFGHDVGVVSRSFKEGINSTLAIGAVLMVAGHLWVTQCYRKAEDPLPPSPKFQDLDPAALVPTESYRQTNLLEEQAALLREQNGLLRQLLLGSASGSPATGLRAVGTATAEAAAAPGSGTDSEQPDGDGSLQMV